MFIAIFPGAEVEINTIRGVSYCIHFVYIIVNMNKICWPVISLKDFDSLGFDPFLDFFILGEKIREGTN